MVRPLNEHLGKEREGKEQQECSERSFQHSPSVDRKTPTATSHAALGRRFDGHLLSGR